MKSFHKYCPTATGKDLVPNFFLNLKYKVKPFEIYQIYVFFAVYLPKMSILRADESFEIPKSIELL